MGSLILVALLLPCPAHPEGDATRLPAGCPAPVDGWLWTRPADAHREALVASLGAQNLELRDENSRLSALLSSCSEAVDVPCPELPPPPAPAWTWAALGAVVPTASVGLCLMLGCSMTEALGAGALGGVFVVGVSLW